MRSSRRNPRRLQSRSENLSRSLPEASLPKASLPKASLPKASLPAADAPIVLAAPVLAPPSAASLLGTTRPDTALRDGALRGTFSVLVAGSVLASGLLAGGATVRLAHADEAPAVAAAQSPEVTPVSLDTPLMTPSIDQNGPIVSVLQPSYNDILRGREATILIEVKAARNPVSAVEIFVDGISKTGGPVPLNSQPSTGFKFDTTQFADGRHRLTVKVTDSQGFIGQSEVWIYLNNGQRTDTAPPSLRWLNMSSGQVLRDRFRLQLQAEDSDFGVKYVLVSINSASAPNAKPVRGFFSNVPPYVFDFDTRTLPDGLYILSARAADSLENEGRAQSITFGIANNTLNPTWISELEAARTAEQTGNTVAVAANPTAKSPVTTAAGARQSGVRTATNPSTPATQRVEPVAPSADAMTVARGPARIGAATRPTKARPSTGVTSVPPTAPRLAGEMFRPRSIPGASGASRPAPNFTIAPMIPSSISGARKPETVHSNPLRVGLPPAALRGGATRSASSDTGGKNGLTSVPTTGRPRAMEPGAPSAGRATVAGPQAPVGLRRTEPTALAALPPRNSTQRRISGAAITVSPVGFAAESQPEYHVARAGETLSAIAARYKMPPAVLAAANNLKPAARPIAGTRLLLPREIAVKYAGKPVTGDVAAIMIGSTSITPFRFLFEQQGGTMTWDGAQQRVVARNETQEITLTIGSRAAIVNREEVMMDLAAFLLSGRTMVPIRFFEKALHAQVEWEPSSGRLYVTMAGSASPG